MLIELINKAVIDSVYKEYGINITKDTFLIEHPNNPEYGDYSVNVAMLLAKTLKQSPLSIAKALHYKIEEQLKDEDKNKIFSKLQVAGNGFINLYLSLSWLTSLPVNILAVGDNYGANDKYKNEKIALEHSNVNPNKAAHVGHLRNACIGQFIERVYEFLGAEVNVQYLDNDLGVQVTTSLMGVNKIKDISPNDYKKYDHYAWDVYARMENEISNSQELQEERKRLVAVLEDETNPISVEQVKLSERILKEQLKTFIELDFDYDVIIRERDIVSLKIWEKAFEQLKKNANFYLATDGLSKGCWLIKLPKDTDQPKNEDIEEDKIIVRSNSVPTYTGKDIAYHMWKYGLLNLDFYYNDFAQGLQKKSLYVTAYKQDGSIPDVSFTNNTMVINVVDVKQTYALDSVRQALYYLGYEQEANKMIHVNYGFVYLSPKTAKDLGIDTSDNKTRYGMSGRKGWGIKIDDFIEMVDVKLTQEYGDFNAKKDVRNGAIKFEMLKYNTFQDLVFDLDSALNMHGFSGPYIQYTHARASSILTKAKEQGIAIKDIVDNKVTVNETDLNKKEIDILRHIYIFPEIVERSAQEFAPNIMCNFLFELAQKYNTFYNDVTILGEKDALKRDYRLVLTNSVIKVLSTGLYLLGINSPSTI